MRLEAGGTRRGARVRAAARPGQGVSPRPRGEDGRPSSTSSACARSAQMDLSVAGDLMGGGEEAGARTAAPQDPEDHRRLPLPRLSDHGGLGHDGPLREPGGALSASMPSPSSWTGPAPASRCGGLLDEMRKLPGFPLETRSRVYRAGRGARDPRPPSPGSRWAPLPSSLFEVPEGLRGPPRGTPSGAGADPKMRLLIAIVCNALALLATTIVPGIRFTRKLARAPGGRGRSSASSTWS